MDSKKGLRAQLRAARRDHIASLPDAIRGLLFRRPPRSIEGLVSPGAVIGLYSETPEEAPASGYARWLFEAGHKIALPWFEDRTATMEFRVWDDPLVEDDLEQGPWEIGRAHV